MNIEWLIPCRYVEVHDNLATIVGAGIDTVWLPELPAPIQLFVAIRLVGLAEEFTAEQQHSATTRVKDPRGNTISELPGSFAIEAESARPDFLTGMIFPAAVQFEVSEEGTYAVEIEVDQISRSLPVHVVHGAP